MIYLDEFKLYESNSLASQKFIITHASGSYKIRGVAYRNLPKCLLTSTYFVDLDYTTLVRFLLFVWLFKYSGDDTLVNLIRRDFFEGVKFEDREFFTKIPTNYTVLRTVISKYISTDMKTKETDIDKLSEIMDNYTKIFTEENVLKMFSIVRGVSRHGKKAENDTKRFYKSKGVMNIRDASTKEDLLGVDVVMDGKTFQVKRPANNTIIRLQDYTNFFKLIIESQTLDIDKHGSKPPYDYLVLWDISKKKMYQIDASKIINIKKTLDKIEIDIEHDTKYIKVFPLKETDITY